jgi:hypothetical protein
MLAKPPAQPPRGAIFILGKSGHRRAGYSDAEASELFARSKKYARRWNTEGMKEAGIDYHPYEIHVFDSLDDLLRKRPKASANGRWYQVIIVTHAQAAQPAELENEIFFGNHSYTAFELQDFAAERPKLLHGFQQVVEPSSTLRVVGCSPATHGPELGIYLRELIGTRGNVLLPRVDVAFDRTGLLGTPVKRKDCVPNPTPQTQCVRAIKPEEWRNIPSKDEASRPD